MTENSVPTDDDAQEPALSDDEREALAAVKKIVRRLESIRKHLVRLNARFPEILDEDEMASGRRPSSVAFVLRTSIECHLKDQIDPLIRGLTAASQLALPALKLEWQAERQPRPTEPAVAAHTAIRVREGEAADLEAVYRLGLASPPLQPSATAPFLEPKRIPWHLFPAAGTPTPPHERVRQQGRRTRGRQSHTIVRRATGANGGSTGITSGEAEGNGGT